MFGRVTEGMDVIDRIAAVQTGRRRGFDDCPVDDVVALGAQGRRGLNRPRTTRPARRPGPHLAAPAPKGLRRRLVRGALFFLLLALGSSVGSVLLMRWVEPWTSAFMVATRGCAARGRLRLRQRLSLGVARADLAACRDRGDRLRGPVQFPFHAGFDFKSIREAVRHNAHSKKVRGASTISQQVAKNLFLWRGRSYLRKGLEAWFTVLIEALWPKERILEVYLNVAEFGWGVYGVEAAAQRFFHKPAARLTAARRRRSPPCCRTRCDSVPTPLGLRAETPWPDPRADARPAVLPTCASSTTTSPRSRRRAERAFALRPPRRRRSARAPRFVAEVRREPALGLLDRDALAARVVLDLLARHLADREVVRLRMAEK